MIGGNFVRTGMLKMIGILVFSCSLLLLTSIPRVTSTIRDVPIVQIGQSSLSRGQLSNLKSLPKQLSNVVDIRGGDSKTGRQISGKKPIGATTKFKEWLFAIPPISRAYILLAVFCSLIPAPALFSLDISRFYELWRPITAMAYLGKPSMSMANNIFFLLNYGQSLELEQGPGAYAWYLLVQTVILTLLGWFLGFPFQAQAMIASIIHVCSRMKPMDPIPFQFGLMITSWQLPFCMMAIDCLSQQSLAPAWPHILGIFSGHVYLFATKIWPALGGKARLQPPEWIIRWLGDKPSSNVPGMDFKKRHSQRTKQQDQAISSSRKKRRNKNWLSGIFASKPKQRVHSSGIPAVHTDYSTSDGSVQQAAPAAMDSSPMKNTPAASATASTSSASTTTTTSSSSSSPSKKEATRQQSSLKTATKKTSQANKNQSIKKNPSKKKE